MRGAEFNPVVAAGAANDLRNAVGHLNAALELATKAGLEFFISYQDQDGEDEPLKGLKNLKVNKIGAKVEF